MSAITRSRSAAGPTRTPIPSGRSITWPRRTFTPNSFSRRSSATTTWRRSRVSSTAAERRGLELPGLFGVFYYRSANPRTLDALKGFLPVPAEGLTREFGEGASAEDVCARTIRALMDVGARHFYISNLPVGRAQIVLASMLERVGES